jgi:hypothetical protein
MKEPPLIHGPRIVNMLWAQQSSALIGSDGANKGDVAAGKKGYTLDVLSGQRQVQIPMRKVFDLSLRERLEEFLAKGARYQVCGAKADESGAVRRDQRQVGGLRRLSPLCESDA